MVDSFLVIFSLLSLSLCLVQLFEQRILLAVLSCIKDRIAEFSFSLSRVLCRLGGPEADGLDSAPMAAADALEAAEVDDRAGVVESLSRSSDSHNGCSIQFTSQLTPVSLRRQLCVAIASCHVRIC